MESGAKQCWGPVSENCDASLGDAKALAASVSRKKI